MDNNLIELDIIDNGMNFEGIAKYNNMVVFVPNAIRGEKIKARIIKKTSSYMLANIEEIIVQSNDRLAVDCDYFKGCGSCTGMHMSYSKSLDIKKDIVKNCLRKQGLKEDVVKYIFGMGSPYNYRNKVQYPVRNINGRNAMGMFSEKSHTLIEVDNCKIQDKEINKIARDMFDLICQYGISCYKEDKHVGDIKNIMVRKGVNTGEILCIFVANNENIAKSVKMQKIIEKMINKHDNIKGIIVNVNESKGNVILSDKNIVIYGEDKIKEIVGDKTYYISTNSFFQVNTIMAETMLSVFKEKLNLGKEENLLELYSGVGTIGIFLSDKVKEIYGAEIVQDAVKMAKENVDLNNVLNARYILGDASVELQKLKERGKVFDNIVVDPPRKGLDEKGIEIILSLKPKKIGYISCNPATLARDLKLLSQNYDIEEINLFDLFPWTKHVECVSVLSRKSPENKGL